MVCKLMMQSCTLSKAGMLWGFDLAKPSWKELGIRRIVILSPPAVRDDTGIDENLLGCLLEGGGWQRERLRPARGHKRIPIPGLEKKKER